MNPLNSISPVLILMFGSTLWGLTWIWLKYTAALGIGPILLASIAFGAQWLLTWPFALKALRRRDRPRIDRRTIGWLCLLSTASATAGIGFTAAMVYGDVVRAMMLFFLIPAWSVLFGRLFLKEPLTPIRVIAAVIAISGALVILGPDMQGGASLADATALLAGFALAGANAIFRYLNDHPIALKLSLMQAATVLLGLLVWWLSPEFSQPVTLSASINAALYGASMLFIAILATQYAVERLPASRVGILMILELLVAVFSAVILGERGHGLNVWLGGMLIVIAAVMEARGQKTLNQSANA